MSEVNQPVADTSKDAQKQPAPAANNEPELNVLNNDKPKESGCCGACGG